MSARNAAPLAGREGRMVIVPQVSGPGAAKRDRGPGWNRIDALE